MSNMLMLLVVLLMITVEVDMYSMSDTHHPSCCYVILQVMRLISLLHEAACEAEGATQAQYL